MTRFILCFILGVVCLGPYPLSAPLSAQTLPFDEAQSAQRLKTVMARLNQFGATKAGGLEQLAYSDEDRKARDQAIKEMIRLGLRVKIDAAGNIIGRRNGQSRSTDAIIMGSHIDTVRDGGRFDGVAGIAAAFEVIELLNAWDRRTAFPLEVVIFANEEGGLVGSLGWLGKISKTTLDQGTASGYSIRDGIKRIGGDPDALEKAIRPPQTIRAFLELHIEQGGSLHKEGRDIGIVTGIVGIKWWEVDIKGFSNHAGTTPMAGRQDALLAAASYVQLVNQAAKAFDGPQVATVGRLHAYPGAPNVIPGQVKASLEIRDLTTKGMDKVFQRIQAGIPAIEKKTGTTFTFRPVNVASAPALMDARLQDLIEQKVQFNQYRYRRMPSGAGHDAQDIAKLAPSAMIFVPSVDGISHSPLEQTDYKALAKGAKVLMDTVLGLDALQGLTQ